MEDNFENKSITAVALATLPYIISSDDTHFIGHTLAEIATDLSNKFSGETTVTDNMRNLAALKSYIRERPEIGQIRLEATSGMYKSPQTVRNNLGELVGTYTDRAYVRDYNSGVNTFRFWDEATQTLYYSERGTSKGEWGFDNLDITNTAITGQNFQAIDVRKRFDNDPSIPKHENAIRKEIGHSKGGHKALVCHLYDLITKINDISTNNEIQNKREKINELLNSTECYCLDTPFLSNEAMYFFVRSLNPSAYVIGDPLDFIRTKIAPHVHLMNLENDYVSAINEKNAFGFLHLYKQTHETVTNSHAVRAFCAVKDDSNGNLYFDGGLTPMVEGFENVAITNGFSNELYGPSYEKAYGDVHKAASVVLSSFDDLQPGEKEQALRAALVKIDGFLNKTDGDVHGSKYYGSRTQDDETAVQKAEKKENKHLAKIVLKAFGKSEVRKLIPKFIQKSKKVEDPAVVAGLSVQLPDYTDANHSSVINQTAENNLSSNHQANTDVNQDISSLQNEAQTNTNINQTDVPNSQQMNTSIDTDNLNIPNGTKVVDKLNKTPTQPVQKVNNVKSRHKNRTKTIKKSKTLG